MYWLFDKWGFLERKNFFFLIKETDFIISLIQVVLPDANSPSKKTISPLARFFAIGSVIMSNFFSDLIDFEKFN